MRICVNRPNSSSRSTFGSSSSSLERSGEQGHLFLDHFFLITNAPLQEVSGEELLGRYRG